MKDGFIAKMRSNEDDVFDYSRALLQEVEAGLSFDNLPVGKLTCTLVRGELVTMDGTELVIALDDASSELATMATSIFTYGTNWYKRGFFERMQPNGLNVLYLSRLTIDPKFRGLKLGLALMQYVLRFVPHDVAVMKPFPLQHESSPDFEADVEKFKAVSAQAGTAKLRKYYKILGFEPVPRSPLMARQAADAYKFIDFTPSDSDMAALRVSLRRELEKQVRAGKKRKNASELDAAILVAAEACLQQDDPRQVHGILSILQNRTGRGRLRLVDEDGD